MTQQDMDRLGQEMLDSLQEALKATVLKRFPPNRVVGSETTAQLLFVSCRCLVIAAVSLLNQTRKKPLSDQEFAELEHGIVEEIIEATREDPPAPFAPTSN